MYPPSCGLKYEAKSNEKNLDERINIVLLHFGLGTIFFLSSKFFFNALRFIFWPAMGEYKIGSFVFMAF